MIQQRDEEAMMRSYLLGDLDETLREEVEKRILCDSGFAERLSVAQDHLIDDSVFDGLSEGELESFQNNFVTNEERRNKIRIAQAFEMRLAAAPEHPRALANRTPRIMTFALSKMPPFTSVLHHK